MGRGQNPTKMEIDLSLKIDTDDEQKAQVDAQVKEYNQEEMAQIPDNNKEELPEATAGEIEDDASVVETSLQDNTKTKEVYTCIFIINNQIQKHNLFLILYLFYLLNLIMLNE